MKLRIVYLIALLGLISIAVSPGLAAAATQPVVLVLGGAGTTSLNVTNIVPGDSGDLVVTLHNAGSSDGPVTIWLSDIVSGEGLNPESETGNTDEPGELDKYILLSLTADGLKTNITLPTTVDNFPQSVSDAKYIRINLLKAGHTITVVWHWQLPPETGNDVQGDTLSVSVNYILEQLTPMGQPMVTDGGGGTSWGLPFLPQPVPPIAAPEPAYPVVSPGDIVQLSMEIVNLGRYDASAVTLNCGLPGEVVVTGVVPQTLATFADHQVNAALGTIQSGKSKIITIAVRIASNVIPETSMSMLLQKASLGISDAAQACSADQYSLHMSELNIEPVVNQYWSAISLAKTVGERANISINVVNICEAWRYNAIISVNGVICQTREIAHAYASKQKDDFVVNLNINGITSQTKQVTLGKGESQYIAFAPTSFKKGEYEFPGRLSSSWWIIPTGKYLVGVNGLHGELTLELWINWPLIVVLLSMIALVIWGLSWVIGRQK
jgi:hypothetical protein